MVEMKTPLDLNPGDAGGARRGHRSLLNQAAVRDYLLERAQTTGRRQFTRVSQRTLDGLEASVRVWLNDLVHRQPSLGKTLMPL